MAELRVCKLPRVACPGDYFPRDTPFSTWNAVCMHIVCPVRWFIWSNCLRCGGLCSFPSSSLLRFRHDGLLWYSTMVVCKAVLRRVWKMFMRKHIIMMMLSSRVWFIMFYNSSTFNVRFMVNEISKAEASWWYPVNRTSLYLICSVSFRKIWNCVNIRVEITRC